MLVVIIIFAVVILAIPAILGLRLAAAKRREQRVGSPSSFTLSDEETAAQNSRDVGER